VDNIKHQHEVTLAKAAAIEEMVKSEGWKILIEFINRLYEQEVRALSGQVLEHKYYKKIGFAQVLKYLQSIEGVVKDKKVREYLEHQGRALALDTFRRMPQYFFEGRSQSKEHMAKVFGDDKESAAQYHQRVYKQEG